MKKVFLPLSVAILTGGFSDVDSACDAAIPGWGKTANLTETEAGTSWTDTKGVTVTGQVGDGLHLKSNATGTPIGFDLITAAELAICLQADANGNPIVAEAVASNTTEAE